MISLHDQRRLNFQHVVMYSMMMSSISWLLIHQGFTLENATLSELQTTSSMVVLLLPIRLPFSQHFRLSMPTMMSGMIHTMPSMPDLS